MIKGNPFFFYFALHLQNDTSQQEPFDFVEVVSDTSLHFSLASYLWFLPLMGIREDWVLEASYRVALMCLIQRVVDAIKKNKLMPVLLAKSQLLLNILLGNCSLWESTCHVSNVHLDVVLWLCEVWLKTQPGMLNSSNICPILQITELSQTISTIYFLGTWFGLKYLVSIDLHKTTFIKQTCTLKRWILALLAVLWGRWYIFESVSFPWALESKIVTNVWVLEMEASNVKSRERWIG